MSLVDYYSNVSNSNETPENLVPESKEDNEDVKSLFYSI